jgi:hypothetical protein
MSSDTKDMEKVQDKVEISTLSSHDTFEKEGPLPRDPPDGGRGWLVVFGCFCGLMATQGYGYVSLSFQSHVALLTFSLSRYSWGVYLDYYNTNTYPGELTNLTWIGSLWFALTNITVSQNPPRNPDHQGRLTNDSFVLG